MNRHESQLALLAHQRREVVELTQSVEVYRGLVADYERRLAEAKRNLSETERKLYE